MKQYTDRRKKEKEEYWKENLVMLSIKDLKQQIKEKRTKKLTEWFMDPYEVKRVVSTNTIELRLPVTIKIHLVVNISRV